MKIIISGETNVGRYRDHNEDAFLIISSEGKNWQEVNDQQIDISATNGFFVAIADGMGGANAGEVASSITVNTIGEKVRLLQKPLIEATEIHKYLSSIIYEANNKINIEAKKNSELKGMGTTIVLGYIFENHLYLVWCGDSRCYIYNSGKNNQLAPFSEDHSLVWNKVKKGELTPEGARLSGYSNILLNVLGDTIKKPIPEFKHTELDQGDRILLCSDGLNSMLSDSGIQQILDYSNNTKETCQSLISAANNAGGYDNISVVVIDVDETEEITKKTKSAKHSKLKKIWFLIIFLSIGIIVSGLIYYSKEVKVYVKNQLNLQSPILNKQVKNQEPRNESHTQADLKSDQPNIDPEKPGYPHNPDKNKNQGFSKMEKSVTPETDVHQKDPSELKKELEGECERIDKLLFDIKQFTPPNGNSYNDSFYQINGPIIENIIYKLDSLKDEVKLIANVKNDKIISVKDPKETEKFLISFKNSIDRLKLIKKEITDR